MRRLISSCLTYIFLWSGSKLYSFVDLYTPEGSSDDDPNMAIAFAADENTFHKAYGNPNLLEGKKDE